MQDQRPKVYLRIRARSWLRRVFQLSGDLDAIVEYNALKAGVGYREVDDYEAAPFSDNVAVLLNGGKVSASSGEGSLPAFSIPAAGGDREARIEAELSYTGLLVQLARLKVIVAGETLYEEVDGKIVRTREPPMLPVPAKASPAPPEDLPRPSGEP